MEGLEVKQTNTERQTNFKTDFLRRPPNAPLLPSEKGAERSAMKGGNPSLTHDSSIEGTICSRRLSQGDKLSHPKGPILVKEEIWEVHLKCGQGCL